MKTIEYYFSPQSPWSYMGHEPLLNMAARHGVHVDPRPVSLSTVIFPNTGGLPLKQRAPQRQAYRLVELKRWYVDNRNMAFATHFSMVLPMCFAP